MVGELEPAVAFLCVALLATAADHWSTYKFAKASVALYLDPGRMERNRMPRWFLRRYGASLGNLFYAPVEALILTVLIEAVFQFALFVLGPSPTGQASAFWMALGVPLVAGAIIVPSNFRLADRLERELDSIPTLVR